jgi:uncharacterized protein YbjT (DUF2867 family)
MLGEPVARRLVADGYRVRVLARSPARAKERLGSELEIVEGDVEQPETLDAGLRDCVGVHVNLAGGPDVESYDRIEHRGTANVAAAAARAGVERISYLSGASVSGENAWFHATKAKFQAEAAIHASGVPYSIYRATWFHESLPLFVRNGKAVVMGRQVHPWHWVAAEDYARMVSTAFRLPEAANKTFYVLGPEAYTLEQALQLYCARVVPDAQLKRVPLWVLGVVARLTRNAVLSDAVRLMRYFERPREGGDPREANALLGAPSKTLAEWCEEQKQCGSPVG